MSKSLIKPSDIPYLNKNESVDFLDKWKPLKELRSKPVKTINLNYITIIPILKNYDHIRKDLQWKSFIVEIMTGVRGIFPNYEYNLVYKKNIRIPVLL